MLQDAERRIWSRARGKNKKTSELYDISKSPKTGFDLFGLNCSESVIYLMSSDLESYSTATLAQLVYRSDETEEGLVLTFSDDDLMDMASGEGIDLLKQV